MFEHAGRREWIGGSYKLVNLSQCDGHPDPDHMTIFYFFWESSESLELFYAREWVAKRTEKTSVPQIFFDTRDIRLIIYQDCRGVYCSIDLEKVLKIFTTKRFFVTNNVYFNFLLKTRYKMTKR